MFCYLHNMQNILKRKFQFQIRRFENWWLWARVNLFPILPYFDRSAKLVIQLAPVVNAFDFSRTPRLAYVLTKKANEKAYKIWFFWHSSPKYVFALKFTLADWNLPKCKKTSFDTKRYEFCIVLCTNVPSSETFVVPLFKKCAKMGPHKI